MLKFLMINPINYSKRLIHVDHRLCKYITNTELIHRFVVYGRHSYPKRPNDARVPLNSKFGQTYLNMKSEPMVLSDESKAIQQNSESSNQSPKTKISKVMAIYLKNAREQIEFMKQQEQEYECGRRHLANMMGLQIDQMNSIDIDNAIKYLMPSGLFDTRARPQMKPPKDIYPAVKQAQFDWDGRPFHSLFYTGRSNFYQTCFELEKQFIFLENYEYDQLQRNKTDVINSYSKVDLTSSEWLSMNEMQALFLEKFEPSKYEALITALERLVNHSNSKLCENFVMKFRKKIKTVIETNTIPALMYDGDGRSYMTAVGRRKLCVARVTVRGDGSGKIDINGHDILYFDHLQDREQIMTPLKFCNLLGKVDIECRTMHLEFTRDYSEDAPPFKDNNLRELGTSNQSGAIRLALSLALCSFVDDDTVKKMHSVGLLSPDLRVKLRKIWGQEGARRKYTWKKR